MKPLKDFYSLKGETNTTIIKPKWTWDENIIPLSEDILIDRENRSLSKGVSEWVRQKEQSRTIMEQLDSFQQSKPGAAKPIKSEKESRVVDFMFKKSKKKENQVVISDSTDPSTKYVSSNMDLSKQSANLTENKIRLVSDTITPTSLEYLNTSNKEDRIADAGITEEKTKSKTASEDKTKTKARYLHNSSIFRTTESKETNTLELNSKIQESVKDIQKGNINSLSLYTSIGIVICQSIL